MVYRRADLTYRAHGVPAHGPDVRGELSAHAVPHAHGGVQGGHFGCKGARDHPHHARGPRAERLHLH
eukprot:6386698-Pyramimonas_sp.AAC.1